MHQSVALLTLILPGACDSSKILTESFILCKYFFITICVIVLVLFFQEDVLGDYAVRESCKLSKYANLSVSDRTTLNTNVLIPEVRKTGIFLLKFYIFALIMWLLMLC